MSEDHGHCPKTSRLLDLPPEIRCIIWDHVIGVGVIQVHLRLSDSIDPPKRRQLSTRGKRSRELPYGREDGAEKRPSSPLHKQDDSSMDPQDFMFACNVLDPEQQEFYSHSDSAHAVGSPLDLRFFQTCQSINREATIRLMSHRCFHFCHPIAFDHWLRNLSSVNQDQLLMIRSVEFDITVTAVYDAEKPMSTNESGTIREGGLVLFQERTGKRGNPWRFEFSRKTLSNSLSNITDVKINLYMSCLLCSAPEREPSLPFISAFPLTRPPANVAAAVNISGGKASHLAFLLHSIGLIHIPRKFPQLRTFVINTRLDRRCRRSYGVVEGQSQTSDQGGQDYSVELDGIHRGCPHWPEPESTVEDPDNAGYIPVSIAWLKETVEQWILAERDR